MIKTTSHVNVTLHVNNITPCVNDTWCDINTICQHYYIYYMSLYNIYRMSFL